MTEIFVCQNCQKSCIPHKNNWRKKYCSKKCNDQHYILLHPDVHLRAWRHYNEKHREEQKNRSKLYYQQHREKMLAWRKKHKLENNSRTRAKYLMSKRAKKVCGGCGSKKNICVHHKDFNPLNNMIDNLAYLCSICHGKKHQKSSGSLQTAVAVL